MNRNVLLLFLLCAAIAACEAGTEKKDPVAAIPVPQPEPSLTTFTDTLEKLDKTTPAAIERAVKLYDLLAPYDSTGADSAASALMRFVHGVVENRNDSLYQSSEDFSWFFQETNTPLSDRQKAILSGFHTARLKPIGDGEGGVYLVPLYETILPTIKARTSAPVDNFLDLSATEDTMPVFLDAGLVVEMPELIDRLIVSENLLNKTLPEQFAAEAVRLNLFYTNALLFGADNTPAVEYNTTRLNEDFKKGYDYLLAKYPSAKAAATFQVWMAVVASGDPKKIDAFRKTRL